MKREFFKTMLLYFLVITALFLTLNIWSGKELWSDDYSSFLYSVKSFFTNSESEMFVSKTSVRTSDCYSIKWITLSCDDKKSVSYLGEENYESFNSFLSLVKTDITKAGTLSSVKSEDFNNAFKSNGICVKFSSHISVCDYLQCDNTFFDNFEEPHSDILFFSIPTDSATTKYLYFKDKKTKMYYRMPVDYTNDKLNGELSSIMSANVNVADSFSFELNFDRKNDNMDRILIDSLVPVSLFDKNIKVLNVESIRYDSHSDIYDSVFKAFNIKKNSARTYTDAEGVMWFIENHANLKVYEKGIFQYETDENFDGIAIGDGDNVNSAIMFANNIYKGCVRNDAFLCLESVSEEDGITTYKFSYATPYGSLYTKDDYGVVMKVKKGNVIFYRQQLLNISLSEKNSIVGSLLNAYDNMYNSELSKTKSELTIVNLYPVNVYNKNGNVEQKWYIEFSDGSIDFL